MASLITELISIVSVAGPSVANASQRRERMMVKDKLSIAMTSLASKLHNNEQNRKLQNWAGQNKILPRSNRKSFGYPEGSPVMVPLEGSQSSATTIIRSQAPWKDPYDPCGAPIASLWPFPPDVLGICVIVFKTLTVEVIETMRVSPEPFLCQKRSWKAMLSAPSTHWPVLNSGPQTRCWGGSSAPPPSAPSTA